MVQVSRLGNPLVNEVINPMGVKDKWNCRRRAATRHSRPTSTSPSWPNCCPPFTRACSRTSHAYNKTNQPRADLDAILLTGIPASVFGQRSRTYTGSVEADLLRLNLAVAPTAPAKESPFGVLGGTSPGSPTAVASSTTSPPSSSAPLPASPSR